jgi:hypothetical protein
MPWRYGSNPLPATRFGKVAAKIPILDVIAKRNFSKHNNTEGITVLRPSTLGDNMELWLIWLVNYLCIAFAFGVASSIGVLREANKIAREIMTEDSWSVADNFPFTTYGVWIASVTIFFPLVIHKMLFRIEDTIPEVAVNLINENR